MLFCGRGLNFFSALRGTNSKAIHYLLSYFFRLNTVKGSVIAPAVDHLRLNTLGDTKTVFLTRQRYKKHPRPFYLGLPPSPAPRGDKPSCSHLSPLKGRQKLLQYCVWSKVALQKNRSIAFFSDSSYRYMWNYHGAKTLRSQASDATA